MSASTRLSWPSQSADATRDAEPSLARQCQLAGVSRATVYRQQARRLRKACPACPACPGSPPLPVNADDLLLCELIDAEYTAHPFYGSRRMRVHLHRCGHLVNRKRIQRLMRQMGLMGMAPGAHLRADTSAAHPQHKVYPYRLRGVAIPRPNQAWSTDITYIRLKGGFAYLTAVVA